MSSREVDFKTSGKTQSDGGTQNEFQTFAPN